LYFKFKIKYELAKTRNPVNPMLKTLYQKELVKTGNRGKVNIKSLFKPSINLPKVLFYSVFFYLQIFLLEDFRIALQSA